jgi:hypothetical protein
MCGRASSTWKRRSAVSAALALILGALGLQACYPCGPDHSPIEQTEPCPAESSWCPREAACVAPSACAQAESCIEDDEECQSGYRCVGSKGTAQGFVNPQCDAKGWCQRAPAQ